MLTKFIKRIECKRDRAIFPIVALVALLSLSSSVHAQVDSPVASKSVDVSFAAMHLIPYGFKDDDGIVKGYFYEVAQALLEDTDLEYQLSLLPLKRLVVEIKRDQKDCVFVARTQRTENLFRFVEPIGIDATAGIVPAVGSAINHYEDLSHFIIGIPRGVSFDERFESDKTLNKVITPDYARSVKMLRAQRVTAIVGNLDSFNYYARKIGENPSEIFGEPFIFIKAPIWLACGLSKPSDSVIEVMKASLKKLRGDGTVQRIFNKYQ